MNATQALSYIKKHGIVLVSAEGPGPKLVEAIAGEPIKGSWWGHPKGNQIFNTLEAVTDSPDILVCRLVGNKVTLVHKRLWPALVRAAARYPHKQLAQVIQEHSPSGKHINRALAFPQWVPKDVFKKAERLSEEAAIKQLGYPRA